MTATATKMGKKQQQQQLITPSCTFRYTTAT